MSTPTSPNFRNLNELTDYLASLEDRLAAIESENRNLKDELAMVGHSSPPKTFKTERDRLPNTNLLSDSFISRAFAIWGHYAVAQIIISIPMFLCYIIFIFVVLGSNSSGY